VRPRHAEQHKAIANGVSRPLDFQEGKEISGYADKLTQAKCFPYFDNGHPNANQSSSEGFLDKSPFDTQLFFHS
jgi:hypothetical protein